MITINDTLTAVVENIRLQLTGGLTADEQIVSFIKSSYGLTDTSEIVQFILSGDDSDAVIDLLSYPTDGFRESIERLIPAEGLAADNIKFIEDKLAGSPVPVCVYYSGERIVMPEADSIMCSKTFLRRLNLEVDLDFIDGNIRPATEKNIYAIRSSLRRKKFMGSDECGQFINDLIMNYNPSLKSCGDELFDLVNLSAEFFKDSQSSPYDILSAKKFFYENAVAECEEFARMMKSYSMEFMMMKRIQPPLIPLEEAGKIVSRIDLLTWIVYRMIIPSVNVSYYKHNE